MVRPAAWATRPTPCLITKALQARCPPYRLRPAEPRQNRAPHDPVLVIFREEIELLREVRHALAVGGFGEGIGDVAPPIAAARPIDIEQAADVRRHVAERIRPRPEPRRRPPPP